MVDPGESTLAVDRTVAVAGFTGLHVLVVHDWITAWGGAERTLELLLTLFPDADLVVGVLGEGIRDLNDVTRRARETWLARLPLARRHHRWFLPLFPAAFATVDARGYDLVLSSAHAFAKMVKAPRGTPHLCYCYSPPRYLWDLQGAYRDGAGGQGRALALAAPFLRWLDRRSAQRVDRFVAISHYIADRILRAYGRVASVVYPPVGRKPMPVSERPRSESLLVLGRLVPYKRVDLAIQAANELALPLIVAGDGPERARLEKMAGPTVQILGHVSEAEAGELMETCRAMLFCAEEDFGIAPVEANSHGLPVVAYGKGAARESMVDGVSAVFFEAQTVASLKAAIDRQARQRWVGSEIRANAQRFTAARFLEGLSREVRSVLDSTVARATARA